MLDEPGSFAGLYSGYFQNCAQCHAPGAPGRTSDIEATLNFATEAEAHQSITQGSASGLVGNQQACNGVRFLGASYETSLVVAVLDENVRHGFSLASHPGCDADAISDMTVKVGYPPSASFLHNLAAWIEAGAPR